MTRHIIGHRYLSLDSRNELTIVEEKNKDFSQWTLRDAKTLYNKTSFPFYQLIVQSDNDDSYYLDYSWIQARGLNDHQVLETVLNQFNKGDFPPQKSIGIGEAYSVDLIQYDFHPIPVKIGVHESIPLAEEDKRDYLLTKEGVDYKKLAETSLFAVGGFIHETAYGTEGIYIKEGYQTALTAKDINLNVLCFEKLGKIRTIGITRNNLIEPIENADHTKQFYLAFKGENFLNKQVALVLGGYLYFIRPHSGIVKKVSKDVLRIDGEVWRYRRRIKEIVKMLDPEHRLGMTKYLDGRWDNREIEKKETLLHLLDLSQTFLVVFETESPLIFEERLLHPANYPRRYFSQEKVSGLIRLGDGRYPAYLIKDDKNGFVISTPKNLTYRSFDDESETDNEPFVVDYKRTTIEPVVQEAREVKVKAIRTLSQELNNFEGKLAIAED